MVIFCLTDSIRDISVRTTSELIIYNTFGAEVVGVRTGKVLYVFTNSESPLPEILRHSASEGLRIRQHALNEKFNLLTTGNKKILVCNFLNNKLLQTTKPDHIILTGFNAKDAVKIYFTQPVSSLILTSRVPSGYYLKWRMQYQNIDTIHSIKKSGAFRMRL
jgi:hypothetical protein